MNSSLKDWSDKYTRNTRQIEDRSHDKKFPNSIRAIIRSVRKYWQHDGSSERHPKQFSHLFWPVYKDIASRYPGNKIKGTKSEDEKFKDISGVVNRLEHGDKDISFFQLRAFAHFIGIPTGLLLLYSQALGDATRVRGDKSDVINLLECSKDAINDLISALSQLDKLNGYMYDAVDDTEDGLEYKARLEPIKLLLDSFSKNRKAPSGSR